MPTTLLASTLVETAPASAVVPHEQEYDHHILFLSGEWQSSIGSEFRMRATIRVDRHGHADGSIYWRSVRIAGRPRVFFGTEAVSGSVQGASVDLAGHHTDPGLALDVYEIALTGTTEEGTFGGRSRAYGDWSGRLSGAYTFRNRS
jgi:hypothetical protein